MHFAVGENQAETWSARNAFWASGVLQARVQLRIATDGFDPTIGIMHHGQRDAPAYAFDLMEPERPKVDAAMLRFVAGQEFSAADFTLRSDGVVRLSPQLARRVCVGIQFEGSIRRWT